MDQCGCAQTPIPPCSRMFVRFLDNELGIRHVLREEPARRLAAANQANGSARDTCGWTQDQIDCGRLPKLCS